MAAIFCEAHLERIGLEHHEADRIDGDEAGWVHLVDLDRAYRRGDDLPFLTEMVAALPVPVHGEPWALRETVLLHELAHHVGETCGLSRGHRAPFPALVLLLVEAALGAEGRDPAQVDEREWVERLTAARPA